MLTERDQRYLALLIDRINVCRAYKPQFGQGRPVILADFEALYGADAFYTWFGLNNPLVYAAHKAAGGITSLYRQIGIGCERVFRAVISDQLGLSVDQIAWSYRFAQAGQKDRTLSLDACIRTATIVNHLRREMFLRWLQDASALTGVDTAIRAALHGCVFEVRQGYKSKDSKRQNADIANAGTAYSQGLLPVVFMFSGQIDTDVALRYVNAGWLILSGSLGADPTRSAYAFCHQVLGYDLAAFFARNASELKGAVERVMRSLLEPTSSEGEAPDEITE